MRALYTLRVFLVSFEALLLVTAGLSGLHFQAELQSFAVSLELNQEAVKYVMFLPMGVGAWVILDCRALLQDDKETVRLLTRWEDYWRLKVHVWIALLYAVIFVVLSLLPWTVKSGISTGAGLLLFVVSLVGQFVLAASVYAARIRVKELLVHASAS